MYTFTGTNTGMLLSRPIITEKRASFTIVDVYQFADGKIVKFWQTCDGLALFEQARGTRLLSQPARSSSDPAFKALPSVCARPRRRANHRWASDIDAALGLAGRGRRACGDGASGIVGGN